ncbi:MAG: hypothetical protein J0I20_30080 [Chloroflexi bacterium]|nr:hypothetical protein [Chloroflexota bacterium]OJV99072.1 MAG: hypothetical protein BGO39_16550 [Chloroflexi bacterium 54-19]
MIVIIAALTANSVALAGFGLDSLIEIFASVVVVWQLKETDMSRDRLALRLIGWAFLGLVLNNLVQSGRSLLTQNKSESSILGLTWLIATLAII